MARALVKEEIANTSKLSSARVPTTQTSAAASPAWLARLHPNNADALGPSRGAFASTLLRLLQKRSRVSRAQGVPGDRRYSTALQRDSRVAQSSQDDQSILENWLCLSETVAHSAGFRQAGHGDIGGPAF